MVFLVPDFWDCQPINPGKISRGRSSCTRWARWAKTTWSTHGSSVKYTYCIILNTHTHIYIYTVYNSIYIYIYIYIHTSFFKHVHIIDVDYIDIALRYVTLNCVYRGTWRWRRSGCDRGTIGGTMSLGKWSRPQKRAHHRWRFVRESSP